MKPIIGITCGYVDKNRHHEAPNIMILPDQSIYVVPEDYVRSVEYAGGIPMVLPATNNHETIHDMLQQCDGVLMVGGVWDVHPELYGEPVSQFVRELEPHNDTYELEVAKYTILHSEKPILGICRGMQMMNIVTGGTLHQDLQHDGFHEHRFFGNPKNVPQHQVSIQPGTFLHGLIKTEKLSVNSFHHQAIKTLSPIFVCSSQSEDGVIESFEMEGERFVLGIQWHPELMFDSSLQQTIFSGLIQASQNRR